MPRGTLGGDPFNLTTSPSAYVPRAAAEQALAEMERWARSSRTGVLLLEGPAGCGKTLLLKVWATRLEERCASVYVPYPALAPDELCAWVLQTLGRPRSEEPRRALAGEAERLRRDGSELVLLIDDAARLPLETARALAAHARPGEGLRLVLALVGDEPEAEPLRAALQAAGVERVRCGAPLTLAETAALIYAELERAGAGPSTRALFDEATLARLHATAGGVPARVVVEASRLLAAARPAERAAADAGTTPDLFAAAAAAGDAPAPPPEPIVAKPPEERRAEPVAPAATPRPPAASVSPPPGPAWRQVLGSSRRRSFRIPAAALVGAAIGISLTLLVEGLRRPTSPAPAGPVAAARTPEGVSSAPPDRAAEAAPDPELRPALRLDPSSSLRRDRAPLGTESQPAAEPEQLARVDVAAKPAQPEATVDAPEAPEDAAPGPARDDAPATGDAPASTQAAPEAPKAPAADAPAPKPAPPKATKPSEPKRLVHTGELQPGEWLAASLRAQGIPDAVPALIAREVGTLYDFRQSRPGHRYRVVRTADGTLLEFRYAVSPTEVLILRRQGDGYVASWLGTRASVPPSARATLRETLDR